MSEKEQAQRLVKDEIGPRAAIVVKGIAVFRVIQIRASRRLLPGERPSVVVEYERPGVASPSSVRLYEGDTLNMDWSGDGPVTGVREVYLRRESHGSDPAA